jgi:chaperone BCS1
VSTSDSPAKDGTLKDGAVEADSTTDKDTKKGGITLSGLLNVIDGVAASEGRILIMTTNHGCAIRFDGAVLEGAILGGGI